MIKIFTKDNCVNCDKTKEWLKDNSLKFEEVAIDKEVAKDLKAKGFKQAPVVEYGAISFSGFNEDKLEEVKEEVEVDSIFEDDDNFFDEDEIVEEPVFAQKYLLSYHQAKSRWGSEAYPKGSAGRSYWLFKATWDSYRSYKTPKDIDDNKVTLVFLSKVFKDIEAAKVRRPLGDFKDYSGFSHEEIYDALTSKLEEEQPGYGMSFLEAAWENAQDLYADFFPESDRLTRREYFEGCSLMLYGSSLGIYLEDEVSRFLEKKINESALGKVFEYKPAPSFMEGDDVDGIVCFKDSPTIALRISIKCLGALKEKTLIDYRERQNKTKPNIYLGFKSLADAEVGNLESIKVDGKGLKTLLKEVYLNRADYIDM